MVTCVRFTNGIGIIYVKMHNMSNSQFHDNINYLYYTRYMFLLNQ